MAKKPSILDIAAREDQYASRRKVDQEKYRPVLEELVAFAEARVREDHQLGVGWFAKTGMPRLNAQREADGLEPFPSNLSEGALNTWLQKHHPVLREAFRR